VLDSLIKTTDQGPFCLREIRDAVNARWWRWFTVWFGGAIWVNISYRFDRAAFLFLGNAYVILRPLLFPVFLVFRIMGARHEIHYRAEIGEHLKILHPSLGVVVSGKAIIGTHLVLTGGNVIGGRKALKTGDLVLGDHVSLGANAVVLGPVEVGSHCNIGAGAVVVKDVPPGATMVGVPAHAQNRATGVADHRTTDHVEGKAESGKQKAEMGGGKAET
jgi:serine acetyltransferase